MSILLFPETNNLIIVQPRDNVEALVLFGPVIVESDGGGVSDHGALAGLNHDDHPQYALADGSRGNFATPAQGTKADTAVQPADISTKLDDLDAGVEEEIVGVSSSGTLLHRLGHTISTLLAAARDRAQHVGTQLKNTISDFLHAADHAPGGTDALPWTTIHGRGLAVDRPAAAVGNAGYVYYSTDTQALERSTGGEWESIAPTVSPGGSDTQVQFNDGGAFGGDADFTYDKTTNILTIFGSNSKINGVANGLSFGGSNYRAYIGGSNTPGFHGVYVARDGVLGFSATTSPVATGYDAAFHRDAAGVMAQRNGTNAQTFRVYDTYTDTSNYGRLALNAGAAGDWVQIAAETAGTGADDYGIALTPSGTGAISAHVPDSTAAGGNARGAYSVDFQLLRNAATQVASGSYAFIGAGYYNTASGSRSVVVGGDSNQATATATGVVAGTGCRATQVNAFVGGGNGNFATNTDAVVSGGGLNLASGYRSWIPGGGYADTRGLGYVGAYGTIQRAAKGDAQVILQPVRQTTASTATVNLTTDAAAVSTTNCMVLPINSGCQFEGRLTAVHAAGAAVGGWKVEGMARRGASGAATVVGVTVTAFTPDAAIGDPTVTVVGGAGGELLFEVTPANATTTYWVGRLELIQAA